MKMGHIYIETKINADNLDILKEKVGNLKEEKKYKDAGFHNLKGFHVFVGNERESVENDKLFVEKVGLKTFVVFGWSRWTDDLMVMD